jgi:hypothetical protein
MQQTILHGTRVEAAHLTFIPNTRSRLSGIFGYPRLEHSLKNADRQTSLMRAEASDAQIHMPIQERWRSFRIGRKALTEEILMPNVR